MVANRSRRATEIVDGIGVDGAGCALRWRAGSPRPTMNAAVFVVRRLGLAIWRPTITPNSHDLRRRNNVQRFPEEAFEAKPSSHAKAFKEAKPHRGATA